MDLNSSIETLKADRPELYDYILGGLYDDEDLCNEFISIVKWHDLFECRNSDCGFVSDELKRENIITPEQISEGKYEKAAAYSYRCPRCSTVETPTAHTRIHGFGYLPALFEFVHVIIRQKKTGRLADKDIHACMNGSLQSSVNNKTVVECIKTLKEELAELSDILRCLKSGAISHLPQLYYDICERHIGKNTLNANEEQAIFEEIEVKGRDALSLLEGSMLVKPINNAISLSTVEEYRYMIQQYLGDWSFGKSITNHPYGIEMFSLVKGNVKKYVIVARQMCERGHITATIVDNDTSDIFEQFLTTNFPPSSHLILYGLHAYHNAHLSEHFKIEQDKYYLDFDINPFHVRHVTMTLKTWFLSKSMMDSINSKVSVLQQLISQAMTQRFGTYTYEMTKLSEIYPNEISTTLDLTNTKRMQLHINECVFLNFYDGLNTAILLALLVLYPSEELRPRNNNSNAKNKHLRNIGQSLVAERAPIKKM